MQPNPIAILSAALLTAAFTFAQQPATCPPEGFTGGFNAVIRGSQTLNLPYIGAVILERR